MNVPYPTSPVCTLVTNTAHEYISIKPATVLSQLKENTVLPTGTPFQGVHRPRPTAVALSAKMEELLCR